MKLFRNTYRVESARLPGWNYGGPGWYFVTVCTRGSQPLLGDVVDGKMKLSNIGEIVADEWAGTPQLRPGVMSDEWVVMPNHIHGIIVIESGPSVVETHSRASQEPRCYMNQFGPQRRNLSSIIRGFKSASTKRVQQAGYHLFSWQARFYDHIIRSEDSLNRVREYIINNPLKWSLDRNAPENLYM